MIDLEARLQKGPLRVRSLFAPRSSAEVARRVLRRRRRLASIDVLVAAACVVLALSARREPVRPAVVAETAAVLSSRAVAFADGSSAELADREAELRVEQQSAERVVTSLRGAARFDIVPNARRAFEVRTRDVRVRVLGTRFAVQELAGGQTKISVDRGKVQVEWLGGSRTLVAGDSGVFPPVTAPPAADRDLETALASPEPEVASPPAAREPVAAAPRAPRPEASSPSWRDYAGKGDYDRAYADLNQRGKGAVRDEPGDLMLAADVARLSSHPSEAVAPLRKLCDVYPSDKRAPVAAFTLGRVLLDDLGRAAEAAAVFEKARVLWPSGPLAEDALAREIEAWKRAGNAERVRALTDQYLREYPAGRHAAALRKSSGR
jgi:transmembrane sensor